MTPDVILIGGAPGVGKSTLARLLAEVWLGGATVEVDRIRSMRNSVSWTDQIQHEQDIRAAARHVTRLLAMGLRPVVVVDAFNASKPSWLIDELAVIAKEFTYRHVSLHAQPDVLNSRISGRPEGGFRDLPICLRINAECISMLPSDKRIVIDTTCKSSEVVRDELLRFF